MTPKQPSPDMKSENLGEYRYQESSNASAIGGAATSPDMGQSVSDAQVEAAARAIMLEDNTGNPRFDLQDWVNSDWPSWKRHARAALLAAERLRAPVGGDLLHELECLRAQAQQPGYPCSPHCQGYLRELALRNSMGGDGKTDREILAEEFGKESLSIYAERVRAVQRPGTPDFIELTAILAAMARTRISVVPDGWRPIETAPGPHVPVIICDGRGIVGEARYLDAPDDGWWWAQTDPTDAYDGRCYPKFWQPLPTAPTLPIAKGETP